MKTLKKFSFGLIAIILLIGCSEDNISVSNDENSTFEISKANNQILNSLTSDSSFRQLQGNFYVWQTFYDEVIFLKKNSSRQNLLIVQDIDSKINLTDGFYNILYLKHSVMVTDLDTNEVYYFKVPKPEENVITDAVKKQINLSNKEYDIVGLISGSLDVSKFNIDTIKEQKSLIKYLQSLNHNRNDCGSGGAGSNSCSNSYCSVSCNSGYYACCSYSCSCIKEDSGR